MGNYKSTFTRNTVWLPQKQKGNILCIYSEHSNRESILWENHSITWTLEKLLTQLIITVCGERWFNWELVNKYWQSGSQLAAKEILIIIHDSHNINCSLTMLVTTILHSYRCSPMDLIAEHSSRCLNKHLCEISTNDDLLPLNASWGPLLFMQLSGGTLPPATILLTDINIILY